MSDRKDPRPSSQVSPETMAKAEGIARIVCTTTPIVHDFSRIDYTTAPSPNFQVTQVRLIESPPAPAPVVHVTLIEGDPAPAPVVPRPSPVFRSPPQAGAPTMTNTTTDTDADDLRPALAFESLVRQVRRRQWEGESWYGISLNEIWRCAGRPPGLDPRRWIEDHDFLFPAFATLARRSEPTRHRCSSSTLHGPSIHGSTFGLADVWSGQATGPDDWGPGDVTTDFEPLAAAYAATLDEAVEERRWSRPAPPPSDDLQQRDWVAEQAESAADLGAGQRAGRAWGRRRPADDPAFDALERVRCSTDEDVILDPPGDSAYSGDENLFFLMRPDQRGDREAARDFWREVSADFGPDHRGRVEFLTGFINGVLEAKDDKQYLD